MRPHQTNRSMGRLFAIVACATTLISGLSILSAAEKWSDSSGSFTVEADFVVLHNGTVYLKKTNGVNIAVPLDRLSAESQQLAKQMAGMAVAATDTDDPAAAIQAILSDVEGGNVKAAWDALPASYQKDVSDIVHLFAQNMDTELWDTGTGMLKKVVQILKEKKDFILKMPQVAQAGDDYKSLIDNWDAIVAVLDTLVNSDITDLQKLQTIDLGVYLGTTGAQLGTQVTALAKAFGEQELPTDEFPGVPVDVVGPLAGGKFSTVAQDGDTATIRFEKKNGETEDMELIRIEGKWMPKEVVDSWDKEIAEAKAFLTTELAAGVTAAKADVLPAMKTFDGSIDKILAAQDEQQFQAAVGALIFNAMGLMGPIMGGGAGGPGAPGAVPFGPGGGDADPFGGGGDDGGADPFGGNDDSAPFGS